MSVISSGKTIFCEGKQARLKLNKRSLSLLKEDGLPHNVLDNLSLLINQDAIFEKDFLDTIETQIGQENFVTYKGQILKRAKKQISLDPLLLDRIVYDLEEKPTIVPSGGKFTVSVFAEGYFFPGGLSNKRYAIFRDRDFDMIPTENVQLLQFGNRPIFLTHRTCIENYLLDADMIHAYWDEKYQEKKEYPHSKWGYGESPGTERIEAWIEKSARNLMDYQIVRWALGDLIRMAEVRVQLKTTWTGTSGKLPDSLSWEDCHANAVELIKEFKRATDSLTVEKFETAIAKYKTAFNQPIFWEAKQYLVWFHGKDMQKEMQKQESNYISLEDFFVSVLQNFDFEQHDDLKQLRKKIEEL